MSTIFTLLPILKVVIIREIYNIPSSSKGKTKTANTRITDKETTSRIILKVFNSTFTIIDTNRSVYGNQTFFAIVLLQHFFDLFNIKNIKGKEYGDKSKEYGAKEEVAFESWAEQTANEYATAPKDEEDRREKLKVLNQIQRDPDLMSDPAMKAAVIKRRMELQRAKEEGVAFEDLKPYIEQHLKDGGDKATALETAIEQFNSKIPEEAQEEAEQINTELDRIKSLANLS